MSRGLLLLLLAATLAAEGPIWHHLPWAVYTEEGIDLAVDLPPGWSLHGPGAALQLDAEHALHLDLAGLERIAVRDAQGRPQAGLRLLRPGDGGALELIDGRLHSDGDLVVLVLSRLEHVEDRRWMVLRSARDEVVPCGLRIAAPEVPLGESGLLALIAHARTQPVWKSGVLVELPASDRHVGWNHRSYRQTLAWLAADLWRRGARRIVLVQPPVPRPELDLIQPLWAQARDVARTYRCDLVEVEPLSAESYWQLGEGLLGDSLNAGGRAAYAERIAPHLAVE